METQGLAYFELASGLLSVNFLGLNFCLSSSRLWKVSAGVSRGILSTKPVGGWEGHLISFSSEAQEVGVETNRSRVGQVLIPWHSFVSCGLSFLDKLKPTATIQACIPGGVLAHTWGR